MMTASIIAAACAGIGGIIAAIAKARRMRRAQEAKIKADAEARKRDGNGGE